MKLVFFGLTISSSWGNGHATLLRALFRQLTMRGHYVVFFERDVPYYRAHRDLHELPGGKLILYTGCEDASAQARRELADADVAVVTSYCFDGLAAAELVWSSSALRVFYDMDTPVTLSNVRAGKPLTYMDERGLAEYDLVLSFTGGGALTALEDELGARKVAPLYGSVDPDLYQRVRPNKYYRADFSYLGTYAADRQSALERLFIEPARQLPTERFVLGGAQYPEHFPWAPNIFFLQHLAPSEHPAFFSSSRLSLNVTRDTMKAMGWCPSGRLFEASACGTPLVSDNWPGLEDFFTPGEEILIADSTADALSALQLSDAELSKIASAARARTLEAHSSARRAQEFEELLARAREPETIAA
ncbi:MAG TPA: glycosyltransferase [Chthoniobacterales bacterium]|nr:glycosyltransferase [Chthoniobacterales bacterium]